MHIYIQKYGKKWGPWLMLGIIAGIYYGLRQFYAHISFFNVDEAVSAVVGQAIVEGGLPYQDAVDHRGPLTYFLFAGIFRVWGAWNIYAVHQVYVCLQIGILGLLFSLGSTLRSQWVGVGAAAFLVFHIYVSPFYEMWPAHTEWLLIFFSVLGYWIYLNAPGEIGVAKGRRVLFLFLSGFLFGVGTLSKQIGALEAGGIGIYLLLELGLRQGNWKGLFAEVGLMLLGFLIPLLVLLVGFRVTGALEELRLFGWHYNVAYYVSEARGMSRFLGSLKMVIAFFFNKVLSAALLVGGFWLLPWREVRSRQQPISRIWIFVGWGMMALLEALIGGRTFIHYLIQFLVPLSLLNAWVLDQIYTLLSSRRQTLLIQIGGVGLLGMLALPAIQHWTLHSFMLERDTSVSEYEAIATYISERTEAEDRLLVWGFSPQLYAMTQLRPATRFSYITMLVGYVPGAVKSWDAREEHIFPEAWERFQQDLAQHPPIYIVEDFYQALGQYDYSQADYPYRPWRDTYYEPDTTFLHPELLVPFYVWKRKEQYPIPARE